MTRKKILVRVNGRLMCLKEAASYCGIPYTTVQSRIVSGMDTCYALTTPFRCDNPDEQNKKLSGITIEIPET